MHRARLHGRGTSCSGLACLLHSALGAWKPTFRVAGTPAHIKAFLSVGSKTCSFITQAEHDSHNWTIKSFSLFSTAFVSGSICIASTLCVPSPTLPSWDAVSVSSH